jgi:ankyrin repeat protein
MAESTRTPLPWAAEQGSKAARLPIDRGADINTTDGDGSTALGRAAIGGHGAAVRLMIDESADVGVRDRHGATVLTWAAAAGHGNGLTAPV